MKGVMRFGMKMKLNPQYIGPYKLLRCIKDVAYKLDLPSELVIVHLVFHMSMLKKYIRDPSLVVTIKINRVKDSLSFEEITVEVLDCLV